MDLMAFRTIHVRLDVRLPMLLDDPLVTRRAVIAMSAIDWIWSMWLVAQAASVDIAVDDSRRDRLRLGRCVLLPGSEGLAAVAGGATGRTRISGSPLSDELMARQAGHLGHAMFMHGHLVMALGAGQRINRGAMLLQYVALVAGQMRAGGNVILMPDRLGGLRILVLIEMAGPTATEIDLAMGP